MKLFIAGYEHPMCDKRVKRTVIALSKSEVSSKNWTGDNIQRKEAEVWEGKGSTRDSCQRKQRLKQLKCV